MLVWLLYILLFSNESSWWTSLIGLRKTKAYWYCGMCILENKVIISVLEVYCFFTSLNLWIIVSERYSCCLEPLNFMCFWKYASIQHTFCASMVISGNVLLFAYVYILLSIVSIIRFILSIVGFWSPELRSFPDQGMPSSHLWYRMNPITSLVSQSLLPQTISTFLMKIYFCIYV